MGCEFRGGGAADGAVAGEDLADVGLAAEDGNQIGLAQIVLFHQVLEEFGWRNLGRGLYLFFILHYECGQRFDEPFDRGRLWGFVGGESYLQMNEFSRHQIPASHARADAPLSSD